MTDNELNRLITEHVIKPDVRMTAGTILADGSGVSVQYRRPIFNYIHDPAATETLCRFLVAEGWRVTLNIFAEQTTVTLCHIWKDRPSVVNDDEKGRALVLATLAAYGVEVVP